ncbi:MAG: hypothetical protein V4717_10785 [Bacteroidota bacterium]
MAHKIAISCMPGSPGEDEWKEDPLAIPALTGWGNYRWNITTNNDSAQFYFNQGINMYYSFHMIEAKASFAKAYSFDPDCAMAYWGLALANGPNINYPDISAQANNDALEAIEMARKSSRGKTGLEKKLIEVIASRYSSDSNVARETLNGNYAAAIKSVTEKYATDADGWALYADALMVQHPWDFYEQNQQPKAWTPELVSVLEFMLSKFPEHPAANHYYIHAVEASDQPGKALPSANRLSVMMPNVSHMVHMPSHTYIRTGNYKQGIDVNTSAINGFYTYSKDYPAVEELAALYLSHNQHMQVACAMMQGSYQYALTTANKTRDGIPDTYFSEQSAFNNYLQSIHMVPIVVNLRFAKWEDLIMTPMADEKNLSFEHTFQLFAKGMAAANLGKMDNANEYLLLFLEKMKLPLLKEKYASFANSAFDVLKVSEQILKGTIAKKQNNLNEAIRFYTTAVAMEDTLLYNEPKDWMLPARHYLGQALLTSGMFAAAENVYKKDLEVNPNNPWALAGLLKSQQLLNKKPEAGKTKAAFKKASANADASILSSVSE